MLKTIKNTFKLGQDWRYREIHDLVYARDDRDAIIGLANFLEQGLERSQGRYGGVLTQNTRLCMEGLLLHKDDLTNPNPQIAESILKAKIEEVGAFAQGLDFLVQTKISNFSRDKQNLYHERMARFASWVVEGLSASIEDGKYGGEDRYMIQRKFDALAKRDLVAEHDLPKIYEDQAVSAKIEVL